MKFGGENLEGAQEGKDYQNTLYGKVLVKNIKPKERGIKLEDVLVEPGQVEVGRAG